MSIAWKDFRASVEKQLADMGLDENAEVHWIDCNDVPTVERKMDDEQYPKGVVVIW